MLPLSCHQGIYCFVAQCEGDLLIPGPLPPPFRPCQLPTQRKCLPASGLIPTANYCDYSLQSLPSAITSSLRQWLYAVCVTARRHVQPYSFASLPNEWTWNAPSPLATGCHGCWWFVSFKVLESVGRERKVYVCVLGGGGGGSVMLVTGKEEGGDMLCYEETYDTISMSGQYRRWIRLSRISLQTFPLPIVTFVNPAVFNHTLLTTAFSETNSVGPPLQITGGAAL